MLPGSVFASLGHPQHPPHPRQFSAAAPSVSLQQAKPFPSWTICATPAQLTSNHHTTPHQLSNKLSFPSSTNAKPTLNQAGSKPLSNTTLKPHQTHLKPAPTRSGQALQKKKLIKNQTQTKPRPTLNQVYTLCSKPTLSQPYSHLADKPPTLNQTLNQAKHQPRPTKLNQPLTPQPQGGTQTNSQPDPCGGEVEARIIHRKYIYIYIYIYPPTPCL